MCKARGFETKVVHKLLFAIEKFGFLVDQVKLTPQFLTDLIK